MTRVIAQHACMKLPDILQIVPLRRFQVAAKRAAEFDAPGGWLQASRTQAAPYRFR